VHVSRISEGGTGFEGFSRHGVLLSIDGSGIRIESSSADTPRGFALTLSPELKVRSFS
jgi:hypothetical protein